MLKVRITGNTFKAMRIIVPLMLLLVLSARLSATPDDGIVQHETLVGYNDESYYCIQLVSYPSGTYYAHKDSAFMISRDFYTARILSRVFISSRNHVDNSTLGNWQSTLVENKDFNFIDFIKAHSINYLYPEIYGIATTELINFKMGMDSLKVMVGYDPDYKMVVKTDRFDQAAPWIKRYLTKEAELNKKYPTISHDKVVKTRYFNGDGRWMFMSVTGEWDAERSEIILAFDRKELMPAVEKARSAAK